MIKLFILFALFSGSYCRLTEYFRWKQLTFQHLDNNDDEIFFPDSVQHSYTRTDYIPYNNVPMSVAHFKDKIFITVARRKPGIPSTLNYVSVKAARGSSPSLRSYPDVRTNELHPQMKSDPHRIVSVYRPRIDECNRLWFVDTGTLQYSLPNGNPNKTIHQIQRPSIWIINLNNNRMVKRYEIPESIVQPGHGLISITIDVHPNNCDAAFAYIPDLLTFRIHVYSLQRNKMWSFSHDSCKSESQHASFDVDGFQYTWPDGIFSITLGNRNHDGYRLAYYHPMASLTEYGVSTKVLQDENAAKRTDHRNDFMRVGYRGEKSQTTMHAFDRSTGVIMFAQVSWNGVSCWNSGVPLNERMIGIIDSDDEKMIYPVDLSIDDEGVMWMATNTMQRFIYGKLNPAKYNFRIWRANVRDVINGTICDPYYRDHYSLF